MTTPTVRGRLLSALRARPRKASAVGTVFVVGVAFAVIIAFAKDPIATFLRPGETITADFSSNYQIRPHETRVDVAGLQVGMVSDVEPVRPGVIRVSMKVDEETVDRLGTEPTATVAPRIVLGGIYTVDLKPGGRAGRFEAGAIPQERTSTPVELDRVLESLPSRTRTSMQRVVGSLDDTLHTSRDDLHELVDDLPATLRPAGSVLEAMRGTRPDRDLRAIVAGLDGMAEALNRRDGQLGDVMTSLRETTRVLAAQRQSLASAVASTPSTLRTARSTMARLDQSLGKLTGTAVSLRPSARNLEPLLRKLEPVLADADPLLADLVPLLKDARPAVRQLVPVAERGTATLKPLRGPVLERVQGPIADKLTNTWRGTGYYRGSGGGMQADHKFYEEIGYMVTNMDRASSYQDAQGTLLGFQSGVNTHSLAGVPLTLPNLLKQIDKAVGGTR